jgi:hypothetical protein
MNEALNTNTLIYQLLNSDAQLSDAQHDAFLAEDRQLYATLLRLPNLSGQTAMEIIQRLLAITERGGHAISEEQRLQEDILIIERLSHLQVADVLQSFSKLVERRVNNQRTSGQIRAYILGTPQLESWAVNHRRVLKKLIRHALGNPVTLTCLHKFAQPTPDTKTKAYLHHYVLRYAKNTALAREVFLFLFGQLQQSQFRLLNAYLAARKNIEAGKGLPIKVLRGIKATFHPKISKHRLRRLAKRDKIKREVTEAAEDADESLVGWIRRYYRSDDPQTLITSLNTAIAQETLHIPHWLAHVYFIVDASASMRGFGNRQYNSMAIAIGLFKVFQQRIRQTQVAWIGATPSDDDTFPQPAGSTTIAPALIEAAKQKPDVIILISDGYENVEQGDTATVLKGIKQLGIQIPIFHIVPAFTERDNIEDRQLGCPAFLETGQLGFLATWLRIRAHLQPELLSTLLRQTV